MNYAIRVPERSQKPGPEKELPRQIILTRRSRNQTGRDKSKSWTLSQSASNGPWVLNEKRYPKSFLPGNVMISLDRYYVL